MRELRPPPGVYGWQEHDGRDEPEPIAVMLCTACSNRLIDPGFHNHWNEKSG